MDWGLTAPPLQSPGWPLWAWHQRLTSAGPVIWGRGALQAPPKPGSGAHPLGGWGRPRGVRGWGERGAYSAAVVAGQAQGLGGGVLIGSE